MDGQRRSQFELMKMLEISAPYSEIEQLAQNIERIYGIQVDAIVVRRTVYGLVGKLSRWIWKSAGEQDDEERLQDLARMTHYLSKNGLTCAGPIQSGNGRLIASPYEGAKPGYLQSWIPGRHVEVTNRIERISSIRAIAKLHVLGSADKVQMNRRLQTGRLLSRMKMKQRTLRSIWITAKEKAPVLGVLESYIWRRITECISTYEAWLSQYGAPLAFCHRDLAPHNLLWQSNGRQNGLEEDGVVSFIDFDHAGFDDPIHDFLQFTSHSLFLADCTARDLQEMADIYTYETKLVAGRVRLLWQLLSWPDILIRNVIEWHRHGYERDKQIRIAHAVQKEEKRRQLLQNLSSIVGFEAPR